MGEIKLKSVILETKYEGVPVMIIRENEGQFAGKFRAIIQAFGIKTSVQDTVGGALDRAIVNISKQLAGGM